MRPFGIGLAGLGRWGRRYLEVLRRLPDAQVRLCADPDREACRASGSIRAVHDFAGLLADRNVRAVIIATPPATHYRLARQALESGRDVLVEKPMAETAAEALELTKLAQEHSLVLAVGYTALYTPGFSRLQDELAQGQLGSIRRAVAVRTSSGPARRPLHNGVLADLAGHDIAIALALLGPVRAGRHWTVRSGTCRYVLQFTSGIRLDGIAAWRQPPHSRRFTVLGRNGTRRIAEPPADPDPSSPLGRQCADFINCCRNRTTPLTDSRLGAAVVSVLEQLGDCPLPSSSLAVDNRSRETGKPRP